MFKYHSGNHGLTSIPPQRGRSCIFTRTAYLFLCCRYARRNGFSPSPPPRHRPRPPEGKADAVQLGGDLTPQLREPKEGKYPLPLVELTFFGLGQPWEE